MSRLTILVVDDSPEDRESVKIALRRDQDVRYRFIEVDTGQAGLSQIENGADAIDLVVLDYRLPDMNAEQFVEKLLNGAMIPPLPIVLLTGSVNRDLNLEIFQQGIQDYFSKSQISSDILIRVVQNAIERYELVDKLVQSERRAEEAMIAAERANRAKSQFLASISHELRTPLAAIVGFAEILQRHPEASDADRMLGMIASSGEHLTTLVNDLLDIAKVEAGTLEVDPVPCDVRQVIEMVCGLMQHRAADNGLSFSWKVMPHRPLYVMIDAVRLRQILINLISNAIKFTETGSIRIDVNYDVSEESLTARVIDTGPGIPREIQDRLFTPFVQGKVDPYQRRDGIGLGLAISRQLAQMMDGSLELESTSDQGSAFRLEFRVPEVESQPNDVPAIQKLSKEHQAIDICRGQRVLVAEDVRANRYLLEKLLNRLELIIDFATNGREAIEKIEADGREGDRYRVVLMDMQMPVMDGYESTRHIKSKHSDLPVIALTAAVLKGDRQRCLDAGCDEVLHKPINVELLEELLVRFIK